ncbi:hypothetical protein SBA3_520031 [Candidatus Sulfopaludibacter sp. SbA3]|nr:hypothetical protein SBA3_520031 [Candidatus Sulfopaludibacter sp. SbA3]
MPHRRQLVSTMRIMWVASRTMEAAYARIAVCHHTLGFALNSGPSHRPSPTAGADFFSNHLNFSRVDVIVSPPESAFGNAVFSSQGYHNCGGGVIDCTELPTVLGWEEVDDSAPSG